ncbi:MAG: PIN domain-containing protein [Verrucomicrobia bacterium]|nr:PIN domain-containing protein [Verrucomicrobiota bacterium]MDA1088522.1 PIN domain-containing protein [Verrucomicrobiota bacterium]
MLSIDTNILLFAQNADCPEHVDARSFVLDTGRRDDAVICELVLVELYLLLRNPVVVNRPLSAASAVAVCTGYRQNPRWRVVENATVMERVWGQASTAGFARRRIIDARLAFTLQHHGVTEFATANMKDFEGLGFARVWNPLVAG